MACGPCGTTSAITDASQSLSQEYLGNRKLAPKLTGLLQALDEVEIRQRMSKVDVSWKPSMFEERIQQYGRKPEGTDVIFSYAPLYFTNNQEYTYDYTPASPEGGICPGSTLCSEPPANQIPGDTFQTFTYRFEGTAWETPQICLKDLLHYENGSEYLRNFLTRVERTPFEFYDNYIRNRIWEDGEKYLLANTGFGLLWNTPERVSNRDVPNLNDFTAASGSPAIGSPTLVGMAHLKHELKLMMKDCTTLNVEGKPDMMLVADPVDMYNVFYHDETCGPCSFVEGGTGFSVFSFEIMNKLPFAFKSEDYWFRAEVDDDGEFYRVKEKGYVGQNGGEDLRHSFEWKRARYGVMTFMTSRPYVYRRFGDLPNLPGQIPEDSLRFLSPRFQFAPLKEKCEYTRGIVAWRGEDEFSFQRTGEKIIHVIFERDKYAGTIRSAASDNCPSEPERCEVEIPVTCGCPELVDCCVTSCEPYPDTAYTVFYNGNILAELGAAVGDVLPFQTLKGVFDAEVIGVNSDGTIVTIGIDPAQHDGGHFCCTDKMIGFVKTEEEPKCKVCIEGGLCPSPWDPTILIGKLNSNVFTAAAGAVVCIEVDAGCGTPMYVDATLSAIEGCRVEITLDQPDFTTADFPDGFPCQDAKTLCDPAAKDCECKPLPAEPCEEDPVEPLPLAKKKKGDKPAKGENPKQEVKTKEKK